MNTRFAKRGLWSSKLMLSLTLLGGLLVGGTAVSTEASQLGRIDVTPAEVTLNLNGKQQFKANGFDLSGNEMPVQASWSATGGSIDSETGLYTATSAGDFTVTASVPGSTVTGTASVHVGPPVLKTINVTPPEVTLDPGGEQTFTATGYDDQGNELAIDPIWTATGGTISSQGRYTAGSRPGIYLVTARVSGSSVRGSATTWIVIRPTVLRKMVVTPRSATLDPGGEQTFTATGYDEQGNEIATTPIWSATGGTITPSGLYATGTTPGDFTVIASVSGSTVTGTASVHVDPPELARIDTTPPEVTLNVNEQQQFHAKGYDAQGNEIPITSGWSATGGTITPSGLYTTGTTPGDFTVTASVEGSTVTGTASVHANPPELTRIDTTPPDVTLNMSEQQQFQAKGYDAQGNEIPITPSWSATGGTITPSGLYTTGTTPGDFTVTASVEGSTVTGTASVHANPLSLPMQIYEHPALGTLCYPLDWKVTSVGPDHLIVTDPTGQVLAGYVLWDREMGSSPEDFINSYYAKKPEGTVVDESAVASLCGSSALSTTLRYPWGIVEIITVKMLEGRPAKLFVEGPPDKVAEFVSMGYYAGMAGCCQFP